MYFCQLPFALLQIQFHDPLHCGSDVTVLDVYKRQAEYYAWIFEFILTRWFHEKEKIPVSQLMELYDLIISKPLEAILESDIKKDKMSD